MSADTGGAAFPPYPSAVLEEIAQQRLLDYFAGQALAGWLSSMDQSITPDEGQPEEVEHQQAVARWCYGYAAAMLTERARRTEGK